MITNSKEADSPARQGGNSTNDGNNKTGKGGSSASSSSPWLRLKDPRIVRVSRAFGGKDRHSKVCTIRGLRDRRVRLSVPTAIQLYDLQDRLGLNQPSKVVDWLLNAAKHEIDELPPLPVLPPGSFSLNHQMMLNSHQEVSASQSKEAVFKTSSPNWEEDIQAAGGLSRSSFWNSDAFWRAKSKEVERETSENTKENWNKRSQENKQAAAAGSNDGDGAQAQASSSTDNFLQRALFNNALPFGPYYHLEPSSFPLSHLGSHGFASHSEDHNNFNIVSLPSALSLSSGSQILVCPPPGAAQPLFPSHASGSGGASSASLEIDSRQINHFQMLSSGSHSQNGLFPNSMSPPAVYSLTQSNINRPFHLSMTPRLFPHSHGSHHPDKEHELPSK